MLSPVAFSDDEDAENFRTKLQDVSCEDKISRSPFTSKENSTEIIRERLNEELLKMMLYEKSKPLPDVLIRPESNDPDDPYGAFGTIIDSPSKIIRSSGKKDDSACDTPQSTTDKLTRRIQRRSRLLAIINGEIPTPTSTKRRSRRLTGYDSDDSDETISDSDRNRNDYEDENTDDDDDDDNNNDDDDDDEEESEKENENDDYDSFDEMSKIFSSPLDSASRRSNRIRKHAAFTWDRKDEMPIFNLLPKHKRLEFQIKIENTPKNSAMTPSRRKSNFKNETPVRREVAPIKTPSRGKLLITGPTKSIHYDRTPMPNHKEALKVLGVRFKHELQPVTAAKRRKSDDNPYSPYSRLLEKTVKTTPLQTRSAARLSNSGNKTPTRSCTTRSARKRRLQFEPQNVVEISSDSESDDDILVLKPKRYRKMSSSEEEDLPLASFITAKKMKSK